MDDILEIMETPYNEDRIVKLDYFSYQPFSVSALSNNDEIRICIQQQDVYTLPCDSYLLIDGELSGVPAGSDVQLVNNWLAHCFTEIRYLLNSIEIDRSRMPGIMSTIKGYVTFSPNDHTRFENAGWSVVTANTSMKFEVCIPLRLLLGFAEDHKKVIVNCRQDLILQRSGTDLNCIYSTNENLSSCKIILNKVIWKVPHVSVSDAMRLDMLKILETSTPLQIAFRSWDLYENPGLPNSKKQSWTVKTSSQTESPRFVIVAFQVDRKNKINKDSSRFDHCSLSSLKVYLNSESYPYDNLRMDFSNDKYAVPYHMYTQFQEAFYEKEMACPMLTKTEFKTIAPLIVIDCSRQNEKLKNAPVDIRLEFESDENFPTNTTAYCLIVHDKMFEYNPMTNEVHKIL
ncbi:uncharacterized protein LOC126908179 [Daktulosphaira vitifoliae]|uniref:uncharacterized protein LOC126908179 n=1 Tax=Daktulosphaira vitifoliae TaxID=58002 RepID=UPI0021A991ED|nr:uncharacterized protein LOC126908179 [Daktulosphaira vitifoliae]